MPLDQSLDIIVPCFNPRPGWERILADSINSIKLGLPAGVLQSVILVNDGSTSGMADDEIADLGRHLPEVKLIEYSSNKGKGYAVRSGVRSSDADIQIYTDIDIPYTNQAIVDFYHALANDTTDVIVASRGNSYYDSLSSFRRTLSKSLRWLNGFLFGLKTKDTQGGLKGFNSKGKEVFLETRVNRYLFDLEFIQKASKQGLRISAQPVSLKPGVILPAISLFVLVEELHNFIRLLFWR